MIRFKILLPRFCNDGRPIEREKFVQTDDDLVQLVSATSTDTVVVRERWLYQRTLYQDQANFGAGRGRDHGSERRLKTKNKGKDQKRLALASAAWYSAGP